MIRNSNSVVNSAHVVEVFGCAADFENDPQRRSEVKPMRSSSERPVGVGSRAVENVPFLGQTTRTTTVISEYQPNRRVAAEYVTGQAARA